MEILYQLASSPIFIIAAVVLFLLLIGLSVYGRFNDARKPRAKTSDKFALENLLKKVNQHGNINDQNTPKPLISLEEFFIGNNDHASIGYNFYPNQPSPKAFYDLFRRIRRKPGVHDVIVQVNDQIESTDWPSTDTVWIITSASVDDVKRWLGRKFQADDLLVGFPTTPIIEDYPIPLGMKALGVWWD